MDNDARNFFKKIERIDVPFNWGSIRSAFKNERIYIRELIEDTIDAIDNLSNDMKDFNNFVLTVNLGVKPEEPSWEESSAIQYIQSSFLKSLENQKFIDNLIFKVVNDEKSNCMFLEAMFTVRDAQGFRKRAASLISKHLVNNGESSKYKFYEKPRYIRDRIIWGGESISFRGSTSTLISIFFENPRVYRGDKIINEGALVPRKELQNSTGYTEETFRNMVKKVKARLKTRGFPMNIKSHKQNHYLMSIFLSESK